MKTPTAKWTRRFWPVMSLLISLVASAQTASEPAVLHGRVFNAATGQPIGNAQLTVEGSGLEAFSDTDGSYRLAPLAAGIVRVNAFYTGLQPRTEALSLSAGQSFAHDFALALPPTGTEPIILPRYRVEASREIAATAVAIHEQRFAPNIKTVVAIDEFGPIAEGNVAEFLKFLPGVGVVMQAGNARFISINGVPPENVPVTLNGFNLASASTDGINARFVSVDLVSTTNNLSRVELAFSPTPESPGSALAGSVNMIARSAFERVRPVFEARAFVALNDSAPLLRKEQGPRGRGMRNLQPGIELSYAVPVSRRFGFTFSAARSTRYEPFASINSTWRGGNAPTTGTTFAHTTPDRPYLSYYSVGTAPKWTTRTSFGTTLDYRLTPASRLSFTFQYVSFDVWFLGRGLAFNAGRVLPGQFGPDFTRGSPATGNVMLTSGDWNRFNRSYMPTITWRHDGPTWKLEAGAALSQHSDYRRDTEKGSFREVTALRSGVTVAFDDITPLRPERISVTDGATGAPVDPHALASYAMYSGSTYPLSIYDLQRSAHASARRDYHGRVPLTLKTGVDFRHTRRDARGANISHSWLGRDGRQTLNPVGDDSAGPFLHAGFSEREFPFGFPRTEGFSPRDLWAYYQANPTHLGVDPTAQYRAQVTESKFASELISAAYVRTDAAFFERRLKLVGGVRAEEAQVRAQGPLTDPSRNLRRDPQGNLVRGANGAPVTMATTALQIAQLTYLDRGTRVEKEYLRLFPSLNASYNLRENLIARAAVYSSIGRPNFIQYTGALTLPNTAVTPAPANRIDVNNAGIKPWTANSVRLRFEYYFAGVGQISAGAYRRHFRNFWEDVVTAPTPEFLDHYGLDPEFYGHYDVSTERNIAGVVRMEGLELDYKQALTFLPAWARGVQVFANVSSWRAAGANLGRFTSASNAPRSGSWGASLSRERFNLRANWNYRSQQRGSAVAAGPSIEPGTYIWQPKRLYVDLSGEYRLTKQVSLFANLRNVHGEPEQSGAAGPSTPAYARVGARYVYGSLWTFGVRGTF